MDLYKNFDEKGTHFHENKIIKTKKEFDDWIEKVTDDSKNDPEHWIFRGVNEAKYKLYNSFQRLWHKRNISDVKVDCIKSIQGMIDYCANNNAFANYWAELGVKINDWFILSFLQHYGAATPLLDFSKDCRAALFFALKGLVYHEPAEEIDKYVSIYYLKGVDALNGNGLMKSVYKVAKEKNKTVFKGTNDATSFWQNLMKFNMIAKNNPLLLIPRYSKPKSINDKKGIPRYTVANLNESSQSGEFICNINMDIPLEDCGNDKFPMKNHLYCVNIHKALADYIVKKQLGGSLDNAESLYFPSETRIASDSQIDFLQNLPN